MPTPRIFGDVLLSRPRWTCAVVLASVAVSWWHLVFHHTVPLNLFLLPLSISGTDYYNLCPCPLLHISMALQQDTVVTAPYCQRFPALTLPAFVTHSLKGPAMVDAIENH